MLLAANAEPSKTPFFYAQQRGRSIDPWNELRVHESCCFDRPLLPLDSGTS